MRTFVSVDITDERILEFVRKAQSGMPPTGRTVRLDQLHITMAFLGEIDEGLVPDIMQALRAIKTESFRINFTIVGAFPRPKRPSVVWIGPDRESTRNLEALSGMINNALRRFDLATDRKFRPHVTFFRVKNKPIDITEELKALDNTEIGSQLAYRIRLKKSVLLPDGPVYTILDEVVLS